MRLALFFVLLGALLAPAHAQEPLRCATRNVEPYINRQLDARFGQPLTDAQKIELIGRGMPHQVIAVWKSAAALSEDAGGLLCSAVVQLTRPDTGETFAVTVQYTMQRQNGGTHVLFKSATR